MKFNANPRILGIGNALVDIMTQMDEDVVLEQLNLLKGSMTLVDAEQSKKIQESTKNLKKELAAGGSSANTINGLANLGAEVGFVGVIGSDELGNFFKEDLENNKIVPELKISKTDTGRAVALISPDSERTFATYLGAAIELSANDLRPELFNGYDMVHVEGYLVQNHELIETALKMAKENGLKVAIDLASFNVVEANLDFLRNLVRNYVDVVFANEQEAEAFTGMTPEKALDEIAKLCEIAVVKIGPKGALIKHESNIDKVDAIEAVRRDTTGAGDLFASGFLYGLINGLSLKKCGQIGSVLAGNVIEVIGAKMDEERWRMIKEKVKDILQA